MVSRHRVGAFCLHALAVVFLSLVLLGVDSEPSTVARYTRYAVASDHPEASAAGAEVLALGGTAADAAAATMLALGVASPASSGLGGGGFALYYRASDRSLTFLDFRERAPLRATPNMFAPNEARADAAARPPVETPAGGTAADEPLGEPSQYGGLASGVPGEPAGIDELLRRFGSLPRAQVVAPAIRLAEQGTLVTENMAEMSAHFAAQMKRDPVLAAWFEDGANSLRAGQRITNPALARTLRVLAASGAAPFYRGAVARAIVAANRRHGGIMSAADLRAYRVVARQPLERTAFGFRWVTAPPPSAGGATMLASIAFLERSLAPAHRRESPLYFHALAESWKGPFLDRRLYFGDPDSVRVPVDRLLAEERLTKRANLFHRTLARPPADYAMPLEGEDAARAAHRESGGTTHLCVVDAQGNVASVTSTVNLPFGARYTAAGMVMNDEMDDFAKAVGEANAFGLIGGEPNLPGPGRRPVSTMSPTIVFDDQGPVLCIGAAGGSRIVTATEQVALNLLVLGKDPEEAIRAPRVHHQAEPNKLLTEGFAPLSAANRAQLTARGHVLDTQEHIATVQFVRIARTESAPLAAASDPRKGGRPAGE